MKGSADEQKRWDTARLLAEKERKIKELQIEALKAGNVRIQDPTASHVDGAALSSGGDINNGDKGQNKSSALFYDPFEARRARDTDSNLRASVLWSVGATCTAEVVFRNPLCCPLYLTALTLLANGMICSLFFELYFVFNYTHIYTHTCSLTFTHGRAHTHTHTHAHSHIHTLTHIHTHIHTHAHSHSHTHTHTPIQKFDLLFLQLILVITGVEFVATPRSVVIPPRTDGLAVELSITPLAEGVLKVSRHSIILSYNSAIHHITTQYN